MQGHILAWFLVFSLFLSNPIGLGENIFYNYISKSRSIAAKNTDFSF